jgi:hypothetical protein
MHSVALDGSDRLETGRRHRVKEKEGRRRIDVVTSAKTCRTEIIVGQGTIRHHNKTVRTMELRRIGTASASTSANDGYRRRPAAIVTEGSQKGSCSRFITELSGSGLPLGDPRRHGFKTARRARTRSN